MPSPAITCNRLPLNLPAKFVGSGNRLPLNLGVEGGGGPPPDPVEVVGLLVAATRGRWGQAEPRHRGARVRWGGLATVLRSATPVWGGQWLAARGVASPWQAPQLLHAGKQLQWGHLHADLAGVLKSPWRTPPQVGRGVGARWGRGDDAVSRATRAPWLAPPTRHAGVRGAWRGVGQVAQRGAGLHWLSPPRHYRHWRLRWGNGRGLDWIVWPPKPPVEPPTDMPRDGSRVGLDLACPVFSGDMRRIPLNLGVTACWLALPRYRTYTVLNDIAVVRLPDRLPIHVDAVSLSGGRDSWCWDARLALADPSQLPLLEPTIDGPRKVEITINGYPWVIAIEQYNKARVFSAADVSLFGRSVTAQLADPYAAPRTRETTQVRTMVQLAEAELADSDLTLDYGTVSWLVPAGAWYYEGMAPMSALARLAEASGGVVQSHPTDPVVQIRARYPVSPWHWPTTTPDRVLQDDIVTGTRLQLQSRPMFDAVIVAGEHVGVAARVRRDGEAGQTYAPQQIDPLITHADGARERGRNVLSDRGGQAAVEHDVPLFPAPLQPGQPGLFLPLQLVERQTADGVWHGLVTAVRIEARRQDKAVDIVQTVTLERHYTDAN